MRRQYSQPPIFEREAADVLDPLRILAALAETAGSWQSPRQLRSRRRQAADRHHRSPVRLRCGDGRADSEQRPGAEPAGQFLVRQAGRPGAQSPDRHCPRNRGGGRRGRAGARPRGGGQASAAHPDRSGGARLPGWQRLGRLPGERRRVRRRTASRPAKCAEAAGADLHAGGQGRDGPPRREHHLCRCRSAYRQRIGPADP